MRKSKRCCPSLRGSKPATSHHAAWPRGVRNAGCPAEGAGSRYAGRYFRCGSRNAAVRLCADLSPQPHIPPRGRGVFETLDARLKVLEADMLADISDAEVETLLSVFARIEARLQ